MIPLHIGRLVSGLSNLGKWSFERDPGVYASRLTMMSDDGSASSFEVSRVQDRE